MEAYVIIVALLTALIVLYAMIKGSHPERWVAVIIITGVVFDRIMWITIGPRPFEHFDTTRLSMDFTQLVLFLAIALRANRLYPLGIASTQLLAIIGSIAALVVQGGWNQAYWAMTQLPLFFQLALLAGGTHAHRLRVAKIGNYNSWSPIQAHKGNPA